MMEPIVTEDLDFFSEYYPDEEKEEKEDDSSPPPSISTTVELSPSSSPSIISTPSSYFSIDQDDAKKQLSMLSSSIPPPPPPAPVSPSPTQQAAGSSSSQDGLDVGEDFTTVNILLQHQLAELQQQNKTLMEQNEALQSQNDFLQKENELLLSEQEVWNSNKEDTDNKASTPTMQDKKESSDEAAPESSSPPMPASEKEEYIKTIDQLKDRIIALVEEKLQLQTTIDSLEHQFVEVELDGDASDKKKKSPRNQNNQGNGLLGGIFTSGEHEASEANQEIVIDETSSQGDIIKAAMAKSAKHKRAQKGGRLRNSLLFTSSDAFLLEKEGEKIDLEEYKRLSELEEAEEARRLEEKKRRANIGKTSLSANSLGHQQKLFSKQQEELLLQDAGVGSGGLMAPSAITPTTSYYQDNDGPTEFDRQSWSTVNDNVDSMVASMTGFNDTYQAKFVQSAMEKPKRSMSSSSGGGGSRRWSFFSRRAEAQDAKMANAAKELTKDLAMIPDTKPRPLMNYNDTTDPSTSLNDLDSMLAAPSTAKTRLSAAASSPRSPASPRKSSPPPKEAFKSPKKSSPRTSPKTLKSTMDSDSEYENDTDVEEDDKDGNNETTGVGEGRPIEQSSLLDHYVTKKKRRESATSFFSKVFYTAPDDDEDMMQLQEEVLQRQLARKRRQDSQRSLTSRSASSPRNSSTSWSFDSSEGLEENEEETIVYDQASHTATTIKTTSLSGNL